MKILYILKRGIRMNACANELNKAIIKEGSV